MHRPRRPRVLLADGHAGLAAAFAQLLAGDCEVVGEVVDGRALLDEAERLKPDVIVLDIVMRVVNALDAARRLKRALPHTRLVFLTMNEDPVLAAEAFRLGASAYLLKSSAASELPLAIHLAMAGQSYVTPSMTEALADESRAYPTRKARHHHVTPHRHSR